MAHNRISYVNMFRNILVFLLYGAWFEINLKINVNIYAVRYKLLKNKILIMNK